MNEILAGFVVQMAGLLLIHSVWLKQDYVDSASLWRAAKGNVPMPAPKHAVLPADVAQSRDPDDK